MMFFTDFISVLHSTIQSNNLHRQQLTHTYISWRTQHAHKCIISRAYRLRRQVSILSMHIFKFRSCCLSHTFSLLAKGFSQIYQEFLSCAISNQPHGMSLSRLATSLWVGLGGAVHFQAPTVWRCIMTAISFIELDNNISNVASV